MVQIADPGGSASQPRHDRFDGFSRDNGPARPHCPFMPRTLLVLLLMAAPGPASHAVPALGRDSVVRHRPRLTVRIVVSPFGWVASSLTISIAAASPSLLHAAVSAIAAAVSLDTSLGGTSAVADATIGTFIVGMIIRWAFATQLDRERRLQLERVRTTRHGVSAPLALTIRPLRLFRIVNLAAENAFICAMLQVSGILVGMTPRRFALSSIESATATAFVDDDVRNSPRAGSRRIRPPPLAIVSLPPPLHLMQSGFHG